MTLRHRYSQDHVTNFQHRRTDFILTIFKEDSDRIKDLVTKTPHAETGGNLFGLWTNQGNAVVLVATGPGKNCKRTSASFYQDIPYMQRVGDLLTTKYPLCHIGEWHSHHQMQLYEPSFGDCNTVQRNYPRGSQGFILMIANILHNEVILSPYKFTDDRSAYKIGKIEDIPARNPFMWAGDITRAIDNGKEDRVLPWQRPSGVTVGECQGTIHPSSTDNHQIRTRRGGSVSRSRSRSRSPIKKNHDDFSDDEEESEPRRPRRQKEANTFERGSQVISSSDGPRKLFDREKSPARNHTTQWYETEPGILKRIMEYVPTLADNPEKVKILRDKTTLNITITFVHHYDDWSIEFPFDFPRESARLRKKYGDTHSLSVRGQRNIDGFEEALESTLQEQCTTCMRRVPSKVAYPSRRERLEDHQQGETRVVQWYDIQPSTLTRIIDFLKSWADGNDEPEISRDKSTRNITMTFKHHNQEWAVEFPPNFPMGNVKLKTTVNANPRYNHSYRYSTSFSCTNASPLSYTVKACRDVNMFKESLQSAFLQYCVKCRKSAQPKRFTRYKYP